MRVPDKLFNELKEMAIGRRISVTRNRVHSDFLGDLRNAKVSISQGGYNSVLEVVAAKVNGLERSSIVVPIANGKRKRDIEQGLRAKAFLRAGLIDYMICEEELSVGALASTIEHALLAQNPSDKRVSSRAKKLPREVIQAPKVKSDNLSLKMNGIEGTRRAIDLVISRRRDTASTTEFAAAERRGVRLPIALASPGIPLPSILNITSKLSPPSTALSPALVIPKVTVLLLNYKRPENLRRILGDLVKQKPVPPDIFLWNNSGRSFVDKRVTWQVNSSANRFCWPRWMMGSLARTRFICTMDDDFTFEDDFVLRDLVRWFTLSIA